MSEDELKDALNSFTEALEELQDNLSTDDGSKPLDADDKVPTNPSNRNQDDGDGSTDQTSSKLFELNNLAILSTSLLLCKNLIPSKKLTKHANELKHAYTSIHLKTFSSL